MGKLGFKSLNNLFQAIEKSKQNSLEKLLFGLNIRHLGAKAARVVAQHFRDIDSLMKVKTEDLLAIEGFGPVLTESIVQFFANKENIDFCQKLKGLGLNMQFISRRVNNDNFFFNKTVVITGVLSFASRTELIQQLQLRGANVSSSISSKVDYLIVGQVPGSKLTKAKKLSITILDENTVVKHLTKD